MISLRTTRTDQEPQSLGVLAEYQTPDDLLIAARRLQNVGYKKLEAFSPFPIHGIDGILGIGSSPLPWIVLIAGVLGGISALGFQWWTNTIDYPYLVSGKPMFSLPANIPVTFEVTILLAASAAFFGMLLLNGLPTLHNPLLQHERFLRVTNDGFFLLVEAEDRRFSDRTAAEVMDQTSAIHVEELKSHATPSAMPRGIVLTGAVLASLALLPPLMIAKARSSKSDKPRVHNFFDMDFQPKFKAQTTTTLFADGRSMRPRVVGTVPRGMIDSDDRVVYGIEPVSEPVPLVIPTSTNAAERRGAIANDGSPKAAVTDAPPATDPNYVDRVPLTVTDQLMQQGRTQFNVHCAVCHGKAGYGNGLASQRALELQQGTWVPPTNLHSSYLLEQPDGQIFNAITNGVRKMPAYGHQIPPNDRWAIVAYMRALQRSQNATLKDVPEDYRRTLREFN